MAALRRILVTGATGKQGGALISALLSSPPSPPLEILALTRNTQSARAKALAGKPNVKLIEGDLDDCPSIFQKLDAPVHALFSVQVPLKPAVEEQQGKDLVDAAAAHGVKFFVYTSVERGGPARSDEDGTPIPHFISKFNIEKHLRAVAPTHGMQWSIIRPVTFMDNLTPDFLGRAFATLWRINGEDSKLQLVSSGDIGRLAAEMIKSEGEYQGRAISFATEEITFREANKVFQDFTGSDIPLTYIWIGHVIKYVLHAQLGMMFDWFKEVGFGADPKEFVGKVSGLQNFDGWLRTASAFQPKSRT